MAADDPVVREDGTLFAPQFGDVYFQADGLRESEHVFVHGNDLPERFASLGPAAVFTIAETGFGTGLNFLAAWRCFRTHAPATARLHFVSFEAHPLSPETRRAALARFPELCEEVEALAEAIEPGRLGFCRHAFDGGRVVLVLQHGPALQRLAETTFTADAWFLDGFAPSCNAELWSPELLRLAAARTMTGGTAATFTVAGAVRRGLEAAGFALERRPGFGQKREMLTARLVDRRADETPSWCRLPRFERPTHVTVAGAGLAGSGAARALAERGIDVTVLDPGGIAAGASGHALAVLQPRIGDEPDARIVTAAFAFTRSWIDAHAARLALARDGVLHPALDPDEAEALRARLARHADTESHPTEPLAVWLDRNASQIAAGADVAPAGGLFLPRGALIRPAALCHALLDHPRITVHSEALASLDGSPVVLAHALAADQLCPDLPLRAARGQLTHLAAEGSESPPHVVLCHDGYLTPAVDGIRAAGATYTFDSRSEEVDPADDARNVLRHRVSFPSCAGALAQPVAGADVGIRALTPDRLPYVGPLPDGPACLERYGSLWRGGRPPEVDVDPQPVQRNVFVTVGHGSRGVATGPFAGEVLAALWCGEPLPLAPDLVARVLPIRALRRAVARGERASS